MSVKGQSVGLVPRGPTGRVGHGDDIQHNDLCALLSKVLDSLAADTSGASGDEDDLVLPVKVGSDAIVQSPEVEGLVGENSEGHDQESTDSATDGYTHRRWGTQGIAGHERGGRSVHGGRQVADRLQMKVFGVGCKLRGEVK